MKGARQLCGMYDTSSHLMKQPCVSCDIPNNMLEKSICKPVLEKDMRRAMFEDSEDGVSMLKDIN